VRRSRLCIRSLARCPLAPAHRSASGLAINICDVLVEEGGPRVEAKRRGGDPLPRASCRAKLRERAGNSLFVWVLGLKTNTQTSTRDERRVCLGGRTAVSQQVENHRAGTAVEHPRCAKAPGVRGTVFSPSPRWPSYGAVAYRRSPALALGAAQLELALRMNAPPR
jgi:hypothetical protein